MSLFGRKSLKPAPRFCMCCGAALAITEINVGFDTQTGEPQLFPALACPNSTIEDVDKGTLNELESPLWHTVVGGLSLRLAGYEVPAGLPER